MKIAVLTILYHFLMRIIVGETVTLVCKNREFNNNSLWFTPKKFEKELYKLLRVKKWKNHVITAKPYQFDIKTLSLKELLFNINQAEIVHEIIIVLSFLPLILIKFYGRPGIFLITSILASLIDLQFVFIQRFNRPRVLKMINNML